MGILESRWQTFWRRIGNSARTVLARGDFSTLIIACLLILLPVLALIVGLGNFTKEPPPTQIVTWPVSLNQLIPIALLSVVFGFLLARSHYSEAFALVLSAIYCVGITLLIQVIAAPGDVITRVFNVAVRLGYALKSTFSGGIPDQFFLIVFLSVLVWFLGHNSAWHIFRLDRPWRAILPPGIVLVLNNFYLTPTSNLDLYLISFVFLSLLLVIRSHIEAREFDWYMNRVAFTGQLRNWFFRAGAIIGLILLLLAWTLPTGNAEDNAKKFTSFLNGDLLSRISQLVNKLLTPLEGSGVVTTDYYGGDTLKLGGAIRLGDDPVMYVKVDSPATRYYWKSRTFDTYNQGEWTGDRLGEETSADSTLTLQYAPTDPPLRQNVNQQFTMATGPSRLIYAAPQPVEVDLPAQADVDQLGGFVDVSVIRPITPIQSSDPYNAVSSISVATAPQLRADQGPYPKWVLSRDLQLPATITARTRQLAQQLTKGLTTNYDKAKVIEQYLRGAIKYNETISVPPDPAVQDTVDWVLFDKKEGYCTYYASAMIVMLRSLGIPSRMAAGFAQGEASGLVYTVRERDAHTWVEVYFPKAGWVEFEPTSAQQSLDRPDPRNAQQTPTPPASPTPTPSPSPTPSPTGTNAGQAVNPPQLTAQPSATPPPATTTPSPAPSPTTPAVPPPPSPSTTVRNIFSWIGLILALIAILSFTLIGLLWWIEYRGLDKLSPVGRAYARLAIYAKWLHIPMNDASTPMERGRRMAREIPSGNRPITSLTDLYIAERYAPPTRATGRPIDEEARAQNLWRAARRAFIESKIRRWLRRE